MHRTIFDTPVVNTVLRALSVGFLKLAGWKVEGSLPSDCERCVIIGAPHTSNWDLPFALMVSICLRLNMYWMGKQQIFRPPFRGLMMWLGGIPVQREQSNNLVESSAQALREAQGPLQLVVAPEGTRKQALHWKSGFYYIALKAEVPIMLAYLDYERKVGGLSGKFIPTGDIQADIAAIKALYAPYKGKSGRSVMP